MTKRHWAHILAAAAVAAVFAVAAPAAAASPPATGTGGEAGAGAEAGASETDARGADGPAATATAYLQARTAALTAGEPAAALSPYLVTGSALLTREARLAAGMVLRGEDMGRTVQDAACDVTVLDVQPSDDGVTVSVGARAVTTITWRTSSGKTDVEGSGVDHTITLVLADGRWAVTADCYADDLRPACLEAAGAPRAQVRAAARSLERRATPLSLAPAATPADPRGTARRYHTIIEYDRPAAQDYADTYCLSYNPTFVRFAGADCANFASQCGRAGGMPQQAGSTVSGWWYDKDGSSRPGDDTYSLSWINVTRQMGFWNTRRTDWETSAGVLSRGDFIYYDWSGDGVWDHVAVVAGTNSSGQKVIDAHTTDHYRVYWKLGSSSTHYKFARTRASWVI